MHNGVIGGYRKIRREMLMRIDPGLFPAVLGSTDSELFFYLLLSRGLDKGVETAFAETIGEVLDMMASAEVTEPFRMTVAQGGGQTLYALRYANGIEGPSLYYACGPEPHA